MRKIQVNGIEYFLDERKYTFGVVRELQELQQKGEIEKVNERTLKLIQDAMGSDIFDSIPMDDMLEVIVKSLKELLMQGPANQELRDQMDELLSNDLGNRYGDQ